MNNFTASVAFIILGNLAADSLSAAQASPFSQISEGEPWTIREIIRGDVTDAREIDSVIDLDGDGVVDFLAWLGPIDPNNAAILHHGGDLFPIRREDNLFINLFHNLGGGVMLNTPTGLRLISGQQYGNPSEPLFIVFEGNPLQITASIPMPPPSPGGPGHSVFGVFPAGDINNDGYDDVFLHFNTAFGWSSVGLLDGATLTYKWVNDYNLSNGSLFAISRWPDPYQDIDGDSVKDFLVSFQTADAFGSAWHTFCLSGADGHEIWTDVRPSISPIAWGIAPAIVDDVNGDGIRDFFFIKGYDTLNGKDGFLRVISGQDGSLIWEIPASEYDPGRSENPPRTRFGYRGRSSPTGDFDGDGVSDISVHVQEVHGTLQLPTGDDRIWMISGADGSHLARETLSSASNAPWNSGNIPGQSFFPLGDIDNDGWGEYYSIVFMPSSIFEDFQIIGRTTLRHPKQASEGELISLDLHIPTGANKPFQILFSTGFDDMKAGVFARRIWNTHLVDTPLLHSSAKAPRLRGTLDANGKGQVRVKVPVNLGLAGQTLYGVAFVEDPTKPDGILTKSSFAVIEILP